MGVVQGKCLKIKPIEWEAGKERSQEKIEQEYIHDERCLLCAHEPCGYTAIWVEP